jgi:hypothetical protein
MGLKRVRPAPKKDFISERLAAYAPEQMEDKWGFYAESGPEPITDTTNLYVHWSAQSYSEVCNRWPTITSRYLP